MSAGGCTDTKKVADYSQSRARGLSTPRMSCARV